MTELKINDQTPHCSKHVLPAVPSSEVYLEDCVKALKRYADNHFDLAIVDPPYGIGAGSVNFQSGTRKKPSKFHKVNDWDNAIPTAEYWGQLFRVSKNQIVWGGNYFDLPLTKSWIIWDKNNGESGFADGEMAWNSFNKPLKIKKIHWCGSASNWEDTNGKIHPTQKPVKLYSWQLQEYATKGMKILDTHLGSGSIALAIDKANKLDNMNLEFVGIELDTEYFNAAVNRFRLAHAQSCLSF